MRDRHDLVLERAAVGRGGRALDGCSSAKASSSSRVKPYLFGDHLRAGELAELGTP